ncbi:MazG-like family protein [Labrenzia sp. VG12]|uniref:MazG-like family protein n=1 Tax=Labrenzia sp. VG12 TaxID=2021862 RepID=UPI000B8C320D|nr:MazG-like family protein [Labrenzia sp. VG12]ASP33438.1 nucleotide pyrophosphohydrolase [Labrenzia sp. VG12]
MTETTSTEDIAAFLARHGLKCAPEQRLLDITSELGEVSKEVLKASNYGRSRPDITADLEEEIGDLLFAVHALAIECGLDPEKSLLAALQKYQARADLKGDIGSGR